MRYLDEDIRDASGKWVLSKRIDGTQFQTRIGRLYNNVNQRARAGGSYQQKWEHYVGVDIAESFKDPQWFGDWCVRQIGWGLGYDLDKDLLAPGNRVYCPKLCVFVPHRINLGIATTGRKGSRLRGAYYNKKRDKWFAQVIVDKQVRLISIEDTEQQAHEAYCDYKEAWVKELATQYRDTIDPRAFNALMQWKVPVEIPTNEKKFLTTDRSVLQYAHRSKRSKHGQTRWNEAVHP